MRLTVAINVLCKESARRLQSEFTPRGKDVEIKILKFRSTRENEVYRCCQETGWDIQSGAIFCGDIADFVSVAVDVTDRRRAALCALHCPPKDLIAQ